MKLLLALVSILIINSAVPAQNAVEINVTSLAFSKEYLRNPFVRLTADGLPAPYQSPLSSWGSGAIGALENCNPCELGDSLPTSIDQTTAGFWGFNLGGEKRLVLRIAGTSPDIVLSPRIRSKAKTFSLTVPAQLVGKIEIYDGATLIAYDNEVNFTGTLVVDFVQYRMALGNSDRRGFGFRKLTFSYPSPQ